MTDVRAMTDQQIADRIAEIETDKIRWDNYELVDLLDEQERRILAQWHRERWAMLWGAVAGALITLFVVWVVTR